MMLLRRRAAAVVYVADLGGDERLRLGAFGLAHDPHERSTLQREGYQQGEDQAQLRKTSHINLLTANICFDKQ